MTTVACDGKYIACDSLMTEGNRKHPIPFSKIHSVYHPLKPSRLLLSKASGIEQERIKSFCVSFAGCANSALRIIRCLEKGDLTPCSSEPEEETSIILTICSENEEGKYYTHWCACVETGILTLIRTADKWALGSGSEYALGAMSAGATAEEAVIISCQHDTGTSLELSNGVPYICELN